MSKRTLATALTVCVLSISCARTRGPENPLLSETYDHDLEAAIRSELADELSLPSHDMTLESERGVVTLEGRVTNLLARRRAQEIVETVSGVRSVVNLIEVEPAVPRSDSTLQRAAVEALLYHPATDAYDIEVEVREGRAVLMGAVSSAAEAELAKRVVEGVDGLKGVTSELGIDVTDERSDREIQAEVEARLRADARVDNDLLKVRVDDGRVMLFGKVGGVAEVNRAAADAWVRGVKQVDVREVEIDRSIGGSSRVADSPRMPDDEIERALELAFTYDPRVSTYEVDAEAANGTVLLSGTVDSVDAKRAAEEDARATAGVSHVDNRIVVQPEPLDDDAVARSVRRAIERHPFVDQQRILVKVEGGVVHLTGTVRSVFERTIADQVAAQAAGVRGVQNELTLRSAATVARAPEERAARDGERPSALHQGSTRLDIPDQGMRVLPAEAVVTARCQQQQRCDAIGAGRLHETFEACRSEVRRLQRHQLDSLTCDAGTDARKLELCLVEVRAADCSTPRAEGEWLGTSCTTRQICRGTE